MYSTPPRDRGIFQLQCDSGIQHFWQHSSLWVQYKWYDLGCRNHSCLLRNQSKSYYYTKILHLLLVKGWHFIIVFIKIYIILKNNFTTLIHFSTYISFRTCYEGLISIVIPRDFQTNNAPTLNCSHSLAMEVHSMMIVCHRLHEIVDMFAVLHFLALFCLIKSYKSGSFHVWWPVKSKYLWPTELGNTLWKMFFFFCQETIYRKVALVSIHNSQVLHVLKFLQPAYI